MNKSKKIFEDVPIKINGKKTKLLSWIQSNLVEHNIFYEPFVGSCVVGANLSKGKCVFNDINPHLINFYKNLVEHGTKESLTEFLESKSELLKLHSEEYYKDFRKKFNDEPENNGPFDFLFLTRACFNGLVRFNSSGGFNTPYCKADDRFTKVYIDKVVKMCMGFRDKAIKNSWQFYNDDFENIINKAEKGDFVYCDPPYFGLHATYFDSWTEESEKRLFDVLNGSYAKFCLSTWKNNGLKENPMINKYWNKFEIVEHSHTYRIGAKSKDRREVVEVLVKNY